MRFTSTVVLPLPAPARMSSWPLGVKHRLALHIVQLAKLPLNILFSQRQKARGKFLFHESPAFFVLCGALPSAS